MQFDQPRLATAINLSMSFEDGVIAVFYKHEAPVNLASRLGYRVKADEARKLAAALTEWADKHP